jgi:hypothetical protein
MKYFEVRSFNKMGLILNLLDPTFTAKDSLK